MYSTEKVQDVMIRKSSTIWCANHEIKIVLTAKVYVASAKKKHCECLLSIKFR